MGFEPGKRYGRYWEDANVLDELIRNYPFNTSGKSERDFENGFAASLMMVKTKFTTPIHTQIDNNTKVGAVFCFGKKHRPDMTLGDNVCAIELKYITYAGLKEAIGQGILYRLRYRFSFLVLIVSATRRQLYHDIFAGKEKDLHDTLQFLADEMNIFTYIVPAFQPARGRSQCISFFLPENSEH